MRTPRRLVLWLLLGSSLLAGLDAPPPANAAPPPPETLRGTWKETRGDRLLRFADDQLVVREDGHTKALGVLQRKAGELTVRNQGLREVWRFEPGGASLRVVRDGKAALYEPLSGNPPELDLTPLPLGHPDQIAAQKVQAIQEELLRRRDRDQAVRTDPAQKAQWPAVDADNSAYLQRLLEDVGWIDAARFGKAASAAAVLLAKHGDDPRVMQAILPLVESEVMVGGKSADLYSVLYDGLQLTLGKKQRFGTQLWEDDKGPFVIPLEDPARVDAFRKVFGLPPLATYLEKASKTLFDGKPIRRVVDE